MSVSENTASILGTIALVTGGIAGGLTLLDWALPRIAKDKVRDKTETLWLWLSYQRTLPYINILRSHEVFKYFCIASILVSPILLLLMVVGDELFKLYRWIISTENIGFLILRIITTAFLAFIIMILVFKLLGQFIILSDDDYNYGSKVLITWFVIIPVFIISPMIILICFILLLYIMLVNILIFLFRISEFVVYRVIEYEKGPILAVAVALSSLGTILKAFAGN
jgi:hypothetical protein